MKHLSITLLFGILLSGANGIKADTPSIDTLMDLSGLNHRIETLPGRIQTTMHQNSSAYSINGQVLADTILDSFRWQARHYLTQTLDENTLYALNNWLQTPLGEKTTRLESRHISPNMLRALVENREKLLEDQTRLQMIVQLERITWATNTAVEKQLAVQKARLQDGAADQHTIDAAIKAARDDVYRYYYPLVIIQMSYTYYSLTDSELQEYIAFAKSAAGQHYHHSMAVLMQGITRQALNLHTSGEARVQYSARSRG